MIVQRRLSAAARSSGSRLRASSAPLRSMIEADPPFPEGDKRRRPASSVKGPEEHLEQAPLHEIGMGNGGGEGVIKSLGSTPCAANQKFSERRKIDEHRG